MPGFYSDEERTAWLIAEQLMAKGRAVMRQAESALEAFKAGKELNRQRCARRGHVLRGRRRVLLPRRLSAQLRGRRGHTAPLRPGRQSERRCPALRCQPKLRLR